MSTTRDQILHAAADLFAAHGYARTSIRQVADRAGANSALIYYYFGSKAELYEAVLNEPAQMLREMLERALVADKTGAGRLRHFIGEYSHFVLNQVPLAALVFRSLAGGDVELISAMRERVTPLVGMLAQLMREAMEAGEFRPMDPTLAVGSLLGTVLLYVLAPAVAAPALGIEMDSQFAERLAEHTADVFLHGVSAEAGALR